MQLHEGEESPSEKASPGKENLTAFERASQEIEMASQELRSLPSDPDADAAAQGQEAEQAGAHGEEADGAPAMTGEGVTIEELRPNPGWRCFPQLGGSVEW